MPGIVLEIGDTAMNKRDKNIMALKNKQINNGRKIWSPGPSKC